MSERVTPAKRPKKTYLGDSVYADFDGYQVLLTTENGYGATNTIALEPEVFFSLFRYIEQVYPIHIRAEWEPENGREL